MTKQEFTLNRADICAIIKECSKNQVSVLKFGGLYLKFGKPTETTQQEIKIDPLSSEQLESLARKALEKDEIETRDEQLKQMQIENPLMAEELLVNGDLDDDDEHDD